MAENQGTSPQFADPLSSDGLTTTERDKRRDSDRMNAEAANLNASQALTTFLLFLFGIKNEGDEFADSATQEKISNAFGIEFSQFTQAISSLRSGETNIENTAHSLLSNTDLNTTNWQAADDALGNYHNLNNLPPSTNAKFLDAVNIILKLEGGWNPNEPDGAVANFGINSKANPDIDVRNLTESKAIALYETRYWNKVNGIDNLDQRAATIAMDLAVNSGPGRANQFLRELEKEGKADLSAGQVDIAAFMQKRDDFYDKLIRQNPTKFAQYEKGWDDRMTRLASAVEQMPAAKTQLASNFDAAKATQTPLDTDNQQPAPLTTSFDGKGVDEIERQAQIAQIESQDAKVSNGINAPAA